MIRIANAIGQERLVPENTPYRLAPDERVIGGTLDGTIAPGEETMGDALLTSFVAYFGIPAADLLATAGKALGWHCATCQYRHELIKAVRTLGAREVLRRVGETLKCSR